MTLALSIAGNVFVVLGSLVFATAALGVIRFPDTFARISAVGTAGGIGIALVLGGAFLLAPSLPDLLKVGVAIALQLTTSAVGSIAIARSAYLARAPLAPLTYDELDESRDRS
ncbi:multicomponent Na+:H+ antiporter subunit G [Microbacterium sp. AG1240]|uniref:cation:proton antiporter n=1 Tax=Microbacterium sp. AG1240 TaxID=2183992 RepID=UPI000EAC5436|nr:monovalent cation/H(+) antiporter subunit G [Microbacterium sp. AG1240]RKT33559.1 multicomponent Na+:H+ antiporter subunit G [Microbacterium sp. AG1240]